MTRLQFLQSGERIVFSAYDLRFLEKPYRIRMECIILCPVRLIILFVRLCGSDFFYTIIAKIVEHILVEYK